MYFKKINDYTYHSKNEIFRVSKIGSEYILQFMNGNEVKLAQTEYNSITGDFEKVGTTYYNPDIISRAVHQGSKYILSFVNGTEVEITEEEYNRIITNRGGEQPSDLDFTTLKEDLITTDDGVIATYSNDGEILFPVKGSNDIVADVSEDGRKIEIKLDQDASSALHFTELALSQITHEIIGGSTVISLTEFDSQSAYEILLEIEGSGSHFGTKCVVFPYNESQCFTKSVLYMPNSDVNVLATLDNDGKISLTLVNYEMTPESQNTSVFVKKLF